MAGQADTRAMVSLKRYLWIIHLAFIAAGVYIGADLFWAIMGGRMEVSSRVPPLAQSATAEAPEKRAFQQYAVIQERNLFGAKGRPASPPPKPSPPAAPPAKPAAALKLVGTVVGSPDYTYAVIEDLSTKRQDLYRLGDLVREAKLVEITRNRVVLDNRGRREEMLSFEKVEPAAAPPESAATSTEPAARQPPLPRRPPPSQPGPENAPEQQDQPNQGEESAEVEVQRLSDNMWRLSREDLAEQMENLGQFMKEARLTPHFTSGQADGFMIGSLPKNSLLERMGLRNGDILKGINGQRFSSMEEVLQIYQQLQSQPTLQLEIERGRRPETLTYEVR
jgi:general secretion pathway protein C